MSALRASFPTRVVPCLEAVRVEGHDDGSRCSKSTQGGFALSIMNREGVFISAASVYSSEIKNAAPSVMKVVSFNQPATR